MNKLAAFFAGAALAAAAVGCSDTSNSNTNTNASNTATVVNNNGNANTAGVTTTNANNANANANSNSNSNRYHAGITKEEYEKNKESYSSEAKGMGSKVGTGAEDGWLWVKTRSALLAADDLRDSTINVDVNNAVITLSGTVASQAQVKKADTVAKGIEGQKGVVNKLKVSADGGNTNGNANKSGNANANANTKKG